MIIFINGPPLSGKTTAARFIASRLINCAEFESSMCLRSALRWLLAIPYDADPFSPKNKDQPMQELKGISPRTAMIKLAEDYMKPLFGDAIFGEVIVRQMAASIWTNAIISGIGFDVEAYTIMQAFKGTQFECLKLTREGCSFEGDSRDYLDCRALGIRESNVGNIFGLDMFEEQVSRMHGEWAKGPRNPRAN